MQTSYPSVTTPWAMTPVTGARPASTVIHREPVVALDGRVVGYTVAVSFATMIPSQQGARRTPLAMPPVPPDVLHAEYMNLDLPNLVADRYVFLAATPAMLEGYVPAPVVPGRLVLELPARFEYTDDAVERCAALRGLGMQLALMDYRGDSDQEALLRQVAFVVIDANAPELPIAALVHHAHAAGVRVLAAGVTTAAIEDECRAAGVDALRVAYGQPPRGVAVAPAAQPSGTRVLRAGELQCLAVMHLSAQPDVDLAGVSQVIDTDPVLTLRLLHLVNSGAFALQSAVDTVHQAVVLLGVREVTTLVAALLLDARPDAMDSLWFILARALTCEELSDDPAGYTVGMLSALTEQIGLPVDVVLEKVGVSQAVADAVRSAEGPLGSVLAAVQAHERKDAGAVLRAGMLPAEVSSAYVRCLASALATAKTVTREPGR
ncbi:EAL and HDOD domain-containing protein [Cellulomonas sp. KRMCY2]|uniref:EAL and HDOD domain-containing protein n=1 Tax=Cellulomonas sp. KRMCY2 TaxID=1304865 RepID=UPI00045E5F57|nr:HDOD domain-containing protein [Cellulomonas sp. KRMCY2]